MQSADFNSHPISGERQRAGQTVEAERIPRVARKREEMPAPGVSLRGPDTVQ